MSEEQEKKESSGISTDPGESIKEKWREKWMKAVKIVSSENLPLRGVANDKVTEMSEEPANPEMSLKEKWSERWKKVTQAVSPENLSARVSTAIADKAAELSGEAEDREKSLKEKWSEKWKEAVTTAEILHAKVDAARDAMNAKVDAARDAMNANVDAARRKVAGLPFVKQVLTLKEAKKDLDDAMKAVSATINDKAPYFSTLCRNHSTLVVSSITVFVAIPLIARFSRKVVFRSMIATAATSALGMCVVNYSDHSGITEKK